MSVWCVCMWGGGKKKHTLGLELNQRIRNLVMCFILFFEGGPQTDGSFLWGAIWFGAIFAPHRWVVLQKLPSLCFHLWGIYSWPSLDTAKPQPNKAQAEGVGVERTPQHPGI